MHYHSEYALYSGPSWTSGVREAFEQIKRERKPGEDVYISSRVFNAYLNILFFTKPDYSRLDPTRPRHEGLLPPGFHVAWPGDGVKVPMPSLWLVREEDLSSHPTADRLGAIPYPNGGSNLFLLRHASR